MNERDALLRSVLVAPADDAPRLVYADWLDENGEAERAEFVRVQCRLARLGPPRGIFNAPIDVWTMRRGKATAMINTKLDEPRINVGERIDVRLTGKVSPHHYLSGQGKLRRLYHGLLVTSSQRAVHANYAENAVELAMDTDSAPWSGDALRERERALLAANQARWRSADLPGLPFGNWVTEYRRGFVSHVELTTADFLAHAAGLFAAQPVVSVRLTDRNPEDDGDDAWVWVRGFNPDLSAADEWGNHYTDPAQPEVFPFQLFDLLPQPPVADWGEWVKRYSCENDAHAALSAACVQYARNLCGLPPLPLPGPGGRPANPAGG